MKGDKSTVQPATSYSAILGRVLQSTRDERGLDQATLAANLGITQGTVTVNANATNGVGTKIDIKKTFDSTANNIDVDGAALLSTDSAAVLAGQTFDEVTLNTSDTLAIT